MNEEKVTAVLRNKEDLRASIERSLGDTDRLEKVLEKVQNDPAMRRYGSNVTRDPVMMRHINSLPSAQKKKMVKAQKKAASSSGGGGANGTVLASVVSMKSSGVMRPHPYKGPASSTTVIRVHVVDDVWCEYDTADPTPNKKATKVVGQAVCGVVYFFRLEDSTVKNLTVHEMETLVSTCRT